MCPTSALRGFRAIQALELLPGRYWLVGRDEGGWAVFKQERPADTDRTHQIHSGLHIEVSYMPVGGRGCNRMRPPHRQ